MPLSQWMLLSGPWDGTKAQPGGPLEKEGEILVNFEGEGEESRPAGKGHPRLASKLSRPICTLRTPFPGSFRDPRGLPPDPGRPRRFPAWSDPGPEPCLRAPRPRVGRMNEQGWRAWPGRGAGGREAWRGRAPGEPAGRAEGAGPGPRPLSAPPSPAGQGPTCAPRGAWAEPLPTVRVPAPHAPHGEGRGLGPGLQATDKGLPSSSQPRPLLPPGHSPPLPSGSCPPRGPRFPYLRAGARGGGHRERMRGASPRQGPWAGKQSREADPAAFPAQSYHPGGVGNGRSWGKARLHLKALWAGARGSDPSSGRGWSWGRAWGSRGNSEGLEKWEGAQILGGG